MVINNSLYPMRAFLSGTAVLDQSTAVSTSVVPAATFTAFPAVNGVNVISFDVQGSDLRVRWDGVAPTSTTGHILPATTAYTWNVDQWNNAQFIRDTTSTVDAVIWASAFMIS